MQHIFCVLRRKFLIFSKGAYKGSSSRFTVNVAMVHYAKQGACKGDWKEKRLCVV